MKDEVKLNALLSLIFLNIIMCVVGIPVISTDVQTTKSPTMARASLLSEPRDRTKRPRYSSVRIITDLHSLFMPVDKRRHRSLGLTSDDRAPKSLTGYHGFRISVFKNGTVGTTLQLDSPWSLLQVIGAGGLLKRHRYVSLQGQKTRRFICITENATFTSKLPSEITTDAASSRGCKFKESQLQNNFASYCTDDFKNSTLKKARGKPWWCLSIDTKGALNVRFRRRHDPQRFHDHFQPNPSEQLVVLYPPTTPSDAQSTIETPHSPRRKTKKQCRKITDKRKRKKCMSKIRSSLRRRNNVGRSSRRRSDPGWPSLFSRPSDISARSDLPRRTHRGILQQSPG